MPKANTKENNPDEQLADTLKTALHRYSQNKRFDGLDLKNLDESIMNYMLNRPIKDN